jgi:hypothetical protein
MKDIFGNPILSIYREVNRNILVAAKSKLDARNTLLIQTNYYGSDDDIKLKPLRGMGYPSEKSRIL